MRKNFPDPNLDKALAEAGKILIKKLQETALAGVNEERKMMKDLAQKAMKSLAAAMESLRLILLVDEPLLRTPILPKMKEEGTMEKVFGERKPPRWNQLPQNKKKIQKAVQQAIVTRRERKARGSGSKGKTVPNNMDQGTVSLKNQPHKKKIWWGHDPKNKRKLIDFRKKARKIALKNWRTGAFQ